MKKNPFAPEFDELPEILPIFPLAGVLLLPCGELPLNVFEPRYLAMVDAAMAGGRMIGMVQPRHGACADAGNRSVYDIGCAGKIVEFQETGDGRYMITLSGISRFRIVKELPQEEISYRSVYAAWGGFEEDINERQCLQLNREKLKASLKSYFELHEMNCDWGAIDDAPDGRLITCLSMVCPFNACEKQALLEAACCKVRSELFMQMLDMETRFKCNSDDKQH